MSRHLGVWAVVAALVWAVGPVFADDLVVPLWRGSERSTFGQWEFDTSIPTPTPELGSFNPFGSPAMLVTPGEDMGWLNTLAGRQGVWQLSGEILVDIPNNPHPLMWKDIQIQLTWLPQQSGARPAVEVTPLPGGEVFAGGFTETVLPGGWLHTVFTYLVIPNPDSERIRISGEINVDELVIDTQCVPEPASLGLMGLWGIGWLIRRRP